jgi:nucleoid DNA-binding protein
MLTRSELVEALCRASFLYVEDVAAVVDVNFAHMAGSLALGQRVELRKIGSTPAPRTCVESPLRGVCSSG